MLPEGDALEGGLHVTSKEPRYSNDVFRADGIALVRHRGGSLLCRSARLGHLGHAVVLSDTDVGGDGLTGGRK